jgi:hypothetical protein
MQEENEVTITVVSGGDNIAGEKMIESSTRDVSASGVKIKTNILLPVDTLIELDFTSQAVRRKIQALGKIKWIKVIIEDESYEAGVELFSQTGDALKRLGHYIAWKLKSHG